MRKILTSATAAVIAAGAVLATAGPANADRRHYRHHDRGNDEVAAAIIGGVAGLALGAALSGGGRNDRDRYYGGYSYDPRYERYSGGYYRGYGRHNDRYRTCVVRDRVYDPYIGRRVTVERRYAC
ncbi:MAG: hypothetical protein U1C74_04240 [Phenylobacterium sp.]|nr:hypothetical protein [Phenylobacterium sp.]